MNTKNKTLTPKFIKKLLLIFCLLIIVMGASYIFITGYYADKYNKATIQQVNANVAKHVIEEKFSNASPFLEDGSVNKPLFGELMHDMMAVNRSIEVYLLDDFGEILYSVVLDHKENSPSRSVSLAPIEKFIKTNGNAYIEGDDPRNPNSQKIFSAAPYQINDRKGFVYIILAGKDFQNISDNVLESYFIRLGLGATLLTMIFAALIALLSIFFLTKNLRILINTVTKFREGDLEARIKNPQDSDIEIFAYSFNEMADTIVANLDKMKSVDLLRRELVANVSHDLRTPLAVLKGYIETLQIKKDTLLESEKDEYLEITNRNINKLSKLINQLFEYSKLEAEQITPIKEPFSLTELSYDLIAKFKVIADKKNIHLTLENPQENCLVFADVSLVERALQNILENAIKFTNTNGTVSISFKKLNNSIEINISDTGSGIPIHEQPFIFDRYKQANIKTKKQGHGLGLAIVKKIMDLHETTITVLSKPKEGSSFIFNLPIYES